MSGGIINDNGFLKTGSRLGERRWPAAAVLSKKSMGTEHATVSKHWSFSFVDNGQER